MKKILLILTITIIVLSLNRCQSFTQESLHPKYMIEHALSTCEDTFFDKFHINKAAAKYENTNEGRLYYLSEECKINEVVNSIRVEFQNERWMQTTYEAIFDGKDYLKDAYDYLYSCDKTLCTSYGNPLKYGIENTTFLEQYPTFESFSESFNGKVIANVGDVYEINTDCVLSITLWADASNQDNQTGIVLLEVYRYQDREI